MPGYGDELVRGLHDGLPYVEGRHATNKNLQFKLGSVGGLERVFSSYKLKTNLKNNSDCLFGPTIDQWHKSPSNGPRPPHPASFRVSGGLQEAV